MKCPLALLPKARWPYDTPESTPKTRSQVWRIVLSGRNCPMCSWNNAPGGTNSPRNPPEVSKCRPNEPFCRRPEREFVQTVPENGSKRYYGPNYEMAGTGICPNSTRNPGKTVLGQRENDQSLATTGRPQRSNAQTMVRLYEQTLQGSFDHTIA